MVKPKSTRPLVDTEYAALAEFRYQLRRYLRHMEEEVRVTGVNPQQYQVVLAIKGLPRDLVPTISCLAERMQLNHNSMVELVDRCEQNGLLRRNRSGADRRQVTLAITADGEALLKRLGPAARQELRNIGPVLVDAVLRLTEDGRRGKTSPSHGKTRTGVAKKAGP